MPNAWPAPTSPFLWSSAQPHRKASITRSDLLGCEVFDPTGRLLGTAVELARNRRHADPRSKNARRQRNADPLRQIHLHQNRSSTAPNRSHPPRRPGRPKLETWRTHSCVPRSHSCERPAACVRKSANTARTSACATSAAQNDLPHPHHLPGFLPRPLPTRRSSQRRGNPASSRSISTISATGRTTVIAPSTTVLSAAAKACC